MYGVQVFRLSTLLNWPPESKGRAWLLFIKSEFLLKFSFTSSINFMPWGCQELVYTPLGIPQCGEAEVWKDNKPRSSLTLTLPQNRILEKLSLCRLSSTTLLCWN